MTRIAAIISYGLPAITLGLMGRLIVLYAMKFSTDVLLVAPYIIGIIFGAARVWDAVTDPMVGYLSDKTTSKIGRRRSWLLAGAIPFGLFYAMVFYVPTSLDEVLTIVWLAFAILGFYTALTVISIPHLSWGTEMSTSAIHRSRFFGTRHAFEMIGGLAALGVMLLMIESEDMGIDHAREYIGDISFIVGMACAALILAGAGTLKENRAPITAAPRGSVFTAAGDVWANPHARLVLFVMLIELIGAATMGALAVYVAQYILDAAALAPIIITIYLIVQMIMVPPTLKLMEKIPKHKLWLYSMTFSGIAFGGLFLLAFIPDYWMRIYWNIFVVIFAGIAATVGSTVGPTVLSDIIDYDEYLTKERKEGAYFAVWNFAGKAAGGVVIMLSGIVLSVIGFQPNVEQTQTVKIGLAGLQGLFPMICYLIGAYIFSKYKLTEAETARVREVLDARQRQSDTDQDQSPDAVPSPSSA